ncbi:MULTISPECIES: single-stranded DNA-binding protein [unclassified Clostridioides]|uniref:single-stranded DNA-binding protein n=1 Tax=unclassified Clostridioides TaxID=2635829 RepID=UPI001D0C33C4|nr:single-stranded DNA-binding protein [Clostridioides sp. ZZV15-6388]MCC0634698.1 single-stranded DNA-binding protein [Clostridioides sp. ES-S-0001-02]MCC0642082.1 single-stranded DNA-binding protein [Clostridioides sp. ES-S-0049-03]MCC0645592.1 single-stranded DNA-binding protein [Clostridioides sp. ZZV14-6150]MCC0656143.1 single-stranded DNA-binding protein [Clostridioides sp. ES-S-0123-01]MCC0665455.1 single-stranded DNA-binding protein [Clostridioides sp. ZZV15-6597]MCC0669571.1 single-s
MIAVKDENNVVNLRGELDNKLEFSHEIFGEKFYNVKIKINRLSDSFDTLPMTVSERLLQDIDINKQNLVNVVGQLRSYNKTLNNKNRLVLTVFVREIKAIEEENKDPNSIFLDGYVCKEPVYRKTPLGREITDLLVAINRPYNKSDYIPSIVWGRNAKFAKNLKVGDRIQLWGRVQSREYEKKIDEDNVVKKMAYEVSISKIKKLDENNND